MYRLRSLPVGMFDASSQLHRQRRRWSGDRLSEMKPVGARYQIDGRTKDSDEIRGEISAASGDGGDSDIETRKCKSSYSCSGHSWLQRRCDGNLMTSYRCGRVPCSSEPVRRSQSRTPYGRASLWGGHRDVPVRTGDPLRRSQRCARCQRESLDGRGRTQWCPALQV